MMRETDLDNITSPSKEKDASQKLSLEANASPRDAQIAQKTEPSGIREQPAKSAEARQGSHNKLLGKWEHRPDSHEWTLSQNGVKETFKGSMKVSPDGSYLFKGIDGDGNAVKFQKKADGSGQEERGSNLIFYNRDGSRAEIETVGKSKHRHFAAVTICDTTGDIVAKYRTNPAGKTDAERTALTPVQALSAAADKDGPVKVKDAFGTWERKPNTNEWTVIRGGKQEKIYGQASEDATGNLILSGKTADGKEIHIESRIDGKSIEKRGEQIIERQPLERKINSPTEDPDKQPAEVAGPSGEIWKRKPGTDEWTLQEKGEKSKVFHGLMQVSSDSSYSFNGKDEDGWPRQYRVNANGSTGRGGPFFDETYYVNADGSQLIQGENKEGIVTNLRLRSKQGQDLLEIVQQHESEIASFDQRDKREIEEHNSGFLWYEKDGIRRVGSASDLIFERIPDTNQWQVTGKGRRETLEGKIFPGPGDTYLFDGRRKDGNVVRIERREDGGIEERVEDKLGNKVTTLDRSSLQLVRDSLGPRTVKDGDVQWERQAGKDEWSMTRQDKSFILHGRLRIKPDETYVFQGNWEDGKRAYFEKKPNGDMLETVGAKTTHTFQNKSSISVLRSAEGEDKPINKVITYDISGKEINSYSRDTKDLSLWHSSNPIVYAELRGQPKIATDNRLVFEQNIDQGIVITEEDGRKEMPNGDIVEETSVCRTTKKKDGTVITDTPYPDGGYLVHEVTSDGQHRVYDTPEAAKRAQLLQASIERRFDHVTFSKAGDPDVYSNERTFTCRAATLAELEALDSALSRSQPAHLYQGKGVHFNFLDGTTTSVIATYFKGTINIEPGIRLQRGTRLQDLESEGFHHWLQPKDDVLLDSFESKVMHELAHNTTFERLGRIFSFDTETEFGKEYGYERIKDTTNGNKTIWVIPVNNQGKIQFYKKIQDGWAPCNKLGVPEGGLISDQEMSQIAIFKKATWYCKTPYEAEAEILTLFRLGGKAKEHLRINYPALYTKAETICREEIDRIARERGGTQKAN
jgi:hypothetical protein